MPRPPDGPATGAPRVVAAHVRAFPMTHAVAVREVWRAALGGPVTVRPAVVSPLERPVPQPRLGPARSCATWTPGSAAPVRPARPSAPRAPARRHRPA